MIQLQNALHYDKKIQSSKKWNFNYLSGIISSNSIFSSSGNNRVGEIKSPLSHHQYVPFGMLNEFIKKIVVHEADKSGGRLNRKQKVDIYFNFVGQIDLSEPTMQEETTEKPTGKKKAKVS